jgi:hypothetical protein
MADTGRKNIVDNLTLCPYDQTEISVEAYDGGIYVITCEACGAQWEKATNWIARVTEPDWDIVKAFQEIQSLTSTRD